MSETNPVFLCQPFQRRQDIYIASNDFFNVNIKINIEYMLNYLKFMGNVMMIILVIL
jgi:hypothetical protein